MKWKLERSVVLLSSELLVPLQLRLLIRLQNQLALILLQQQQLLLLQLLLQLLPQSWMHCHISSQVKSILTWHCGHWKRCLRMSNQRRCGKWIL